MSAELAKLGLKEVKGEKMTLTLWGHFIDAYHNHDYFIFTDNSGGYFIFDFNKSPRFIGFAGGEAQLYVLLMRDLYYHANDFTELHEAAIQGDTEKIKHLMELGIPINVATNDGMTPLHYATMHARVNAVEFLLKHGANPNAKTELDKTPLDHALEQMFYAWIEHDMQKLTDLTKIADMLYDAGAEIGRPRHLMCVAPVREWLQRHKLPLCEPESH